MPRRPLVLFVTAAVVAAVLALTAITGGRFSSYTGGVGSVTVEPSRWWTLWAVPPIEVMSILLGVAYLGWRAHRRHGLTTAVKWTLFLGLVVLLLSVCSPLAALAQGGILSAHMVQHTMIGAAAPLALLVSLPRHAAGDPEPHPLLAMLLNPIVAFLLWLAFTVTWLLPAVHHPVLQHESLWVLQQFAFFATGCLMWMPVLERGASPPRWFGTWWKITYLVGIWFVGVIVANVYWFSGTAFYLSHANAAKVWGLDPLSDQANAGTAMITIHCALTFGLMTWLFFRQSRESALAQRLREAGVAEGVVDDALRHGTLAQLATRRGVPLTVRGGID